MKCPACHRDLKSKNVGSITVDVCEGGCGGIWFDNFELQKVDEESESAGASLLNIASDLSLKIDQNEKRHCPRCEDAVLMKHFFDTKMKIQVDQCAECAGYWLDKGELGAIRGEFKTDAERKKTDGEFFDHMFKDELAEFKAKGDAELEHAQKIARMFRFLCPSYYIPGKQKGGAF